VPQPARPPKPHVAIVGLMGAGKSTVGRMLARRLGLHFADTDEFVVAAARRPIPARCAFSGAPSVVSLGGGALTHGPTRALVARSAVSVYLEVLPKTILARLKRSRTLRPLVGETPTLERIEELLQSREPLYREADVHIYAEQCAPETIADAIVARLAEFHFAPKRVPGRT